MVVTFVYGSLDYVCTTLDMQRLNKQATEALQIIHALTRMTDTKSDDVKKIGYANHPITRMWEGYIPALKYYYNMTLAAFHNRTAMKLALKHKQNTNELIPIMAELHIPEIVPGKRQFFLFTSEQLQNIRYESFDKLTNELSNKTSIINITDDSIIFPWWFRWKPVIASHWASLLRKNPRYYQPLYDLLTDEERQFIQPFLTCGYVWTNKLSNAQITEFNVSYCAPIGTGAPATYRWSYEEVLLWLQNPLQNPKTKRVIKEGKTGIYGDLLKAKKLYSIE